MGKILSSERLATKSNDVAEPDFEIQKLSGLEFWPTPYLKESSFLIPKTSTTIQNGPCYYPNNLYFTSNSSSRDTFFNINASNSLCNKSRHCYYDNSSANDLCDNAFSNKTIKILAIQILAE